MHFEDNRDHVVRLSVAVDERGRPANIAVLEGVSGVFGFNEEAIAAVKRSTFAPATRNGKPLQATIDMVYVFKALR